MEIKKCIRCLLVALFAAFATSAHSSPDDDADIIVPGVVYAEEVPISYSCSCSGSGAVAIGNKPTSLWTKSLSFLRRLFR